MAFFVRLLVIFVLPAANLCRADELTSPAQNDLRKLFLQAEQYMTQNRDEEYLAVLPGLKNYPLYAYLQYQWLKKHLSDDAAVTAFLQEYEQSRYAVALRQKWLQQLGKSRQWQTFLQFYRPSDDVELQCFFAMSQYHAGKQQLGLETGQQLWLSGRSLPAACEGLTPILKHWTEFNQDWYWQRFQNALKLNNLTLAQTIKLFLPAEQQVQAELWLSLHRQPEQIANAADWKQNSPQAGALFAHAIGRWLDIDPQNAVEVWDAEKSRYALAPALLADIEKRLAMALALKRDSRAYSRLSQISAADVPVREWRIRAALNQQSWPQVLAALADLSPEEKEQDKWRYWQARALQASGLPQAAQDVYRQIADKRSLYGFLAAGQLQQAIQLSDHPLSVGQPEIADLQSRSEFQVVAEFLALDRKTEAKRQWSYAIAGLDKPHLLAAAKLAQQWRLWAAAIFTVAKANEWDDLDLRFPLQYIAEIQKNAADQQVEPSLLFGLIRQESAFDDTAESPVGAKGLMQLMPNTAQQMSQELHTDWQGENSLFSPDINLKYGSAYYKKLLSQFKGNHLLSIAAYNAGPNKIKNWLPVNQVLPGDIWIETIPYKETRIYVASVLMYALIYQQRLQRNVLSTRDLVVDVRAQ